MLCLTLCNKDDRQTFVPLVHEGDRHAAKIMLLPPDGKNEAI
jgi:hypothetical protein